MDKPDNFERKIKAKLEEVNTPFDESAWQNFVPYLDAPRIVFWKRWYMPYLFSSLLFLLSVALYPDNNPPLVPPREGQAETGLVIDTLYRRDTVLIVDTVYVYKKIYISEQTTLGGTERLAEGVEGNKAEANTGERLASQSLDPQGSMQQAGHRSSGHTETRQASESENSFSNNGLGETVTDSNSFVPKGLGVDGKSLQGQTLQTGSPNKPMEDPVAMSATDESLFKLERELVSGDTSNLKESFLVKKSKPSFNAEATLSFLLPISGRIEYYPTYTQGVHLGLEWESGIGVYLGAIRNRVNGDIDDDGIDGFGSLLINSFPNLPADITTIDDIYLTSTQWFFPLELRWRSGFYSGFSFESSLGMMGNYLLRNEFRYVFEDRLNTDDQKESLRVNLFNISHLKLGVGTNYLFSRRTGMFLRSHYWLPISGTGLVGDRMHALEIGVGLNYFLTK
nr:hypothetical protein [Cytophagales bacterium]